MRKKPYSKNSITKIKIWYYEKSNQEKTKKKKQRTEAFNQAMNI